MANTKSARKRARQNDRRRNRNTSARSSIKSNLKAYVLKLADSKTKDEKLSLFSNIQSILHKASKRGLFPSLRLDRKLGKLAKKYL